MVVKKLYTKQAKSMISLALSDAKYFYEKKRAERADESLASACVQITRGEARLFDIFNHLGYSTNFHGRISFAQFVGGPEYPVNLIDCWEEGLLVAKFTEQSSIFHAKEMGTPEAVFGAYNVRCQPSRIHALAINLWKLYATGHEKPIKEMSPFFELFELRQDIDVLGLSGEGMQPYLISVCVTLLIAREKADAAVVGHLLEAIPIFKGITQFWEDDAEFARFTERAAQWYLEYCPKHFPDFSEFANFASDVLVPSWILALDKFRQKHLGRPCSLGNHELLELAQSVMQAAKEQNYPKLPALILAQKYYEERFGKEPFNPLPFWQSFLSKTPESGFSS